MPARPILLRKLDRAQVADLPKTMSVYTKGTRAARLRLPLPHKTLTQLYPKNWVTKARLTKGRSAIIQANLLATPQVVREKTLPLPRGLA